MGDHPSAPRTLAHAIAAAVEAYADAPALVEPDGRSTSFHQLGGRLSACIASEPFHGLVAGARVVIALANAPEIRVLEFAVLLVGMVRVPVSARLRPAEIAAIAADCSAALVVAEPEAVALVHAELRSRGVVARVTDARFVTRTEGATALVPEPAPVSPVDEAVILYSSGTTGAPKGAVYDHRTWLAHVEMCRAALPPIGPGDLALAAAPLAHFAGTIAADAALAGAALVTSRDTSGAGIAHAVRASGATVLPLVPVLLNRLSRELSMTQTRLPTLRAVPYGGSTIAVEDLLRAAEVLPGVLYQFYGLAEVLAPVAVLSAAEHDLAVGADPEHSSAILRSCGSVVEGAEVRVVEGRIQLRSRASSLGYLHRPELTAASRTVDGWFDTADRGELVDGRLVVQGRSDDVIITGGYLVDPAEIETALRQHPGVRDACVVGVPDPNWGEAVAAVVTPMPGHAASGLAEVLPSWCSTRLAGFRTPRRIVIVDELPLTAVGKIDRRAVRARFESQSESRSGHAGA